MTEGEHRVTPLELFFDLVFVFAITQVTGLMSDDPTWEGLLRGMLILAALWWAWAAYSWLTTTIDPDEDRARLAMLASMAAMLVAALAVPEAFDAHGVLFGCAYFVVRALHIVLYAEGSPDVTVRQAVSRVARTGIPAPAILIAAGFLDGVPQGAVWALALAIDYAGPYVFGVRGLVISPQHFAERFGLIVIIALGESIVAIGVGAGTELDAGRVSAALLGITATAALWWAYFDVVAIQATRKLSEVQGHARARMARDSYAYLHLPMIAGVVLLALGIKKTLEHVDAPLETVPAVALCGGVALFLAAHVAFRLRILGTLTWHRLLAAGASAALIPLATSADALAALGAVAAVCCALIGYEAIRFREARAGVRSA